MGKWSLLVHELKGMWCGSVLVQLWYWRFGDFRQEGDLFPLRHRTKDIECRGWGVLVIYFAFVFVFVFVFVFWTCGEKIRCDVCSSGEMLVATHWRNIVSPIPVAPLLRWSDAPV